MIFSVDKIGKLLRLSRSQYFRFRKKGIHEKLAGEKSWQKESFYKLQKKFLEHYTKLTQVDNINKFTTSLWKKYNKRIENALLPYPKFSFLKDPTIMIAMFVTVGGKSMRSQLDYLEKHLFKKKLKEILREDYIGDPLLLDDNYMTSHTEIHHLYHIVRFLNRTNYNLHEARTIVEWGGGYGNMVKILRKLNRNPVTYVMIDTPIFCCLQWLYLSVIFGEGNVHLLHNSSDKIIENKINIVSISFLDKINIKADMFISTWALSESSRYSQDYVFRKKWFGARHLLLAFQKSNQILPNASRVGNFAKKFGAKIEDVEGWTDNYYAFL